MKKVLRMENLDCANCAAKMEKKIKKIAGVNEVSISFMAQKMVLDCDETRYDEIFDEVQRAVRSVDKDCSVLK